MLVAFLPKYDVRNCTMCHEDEVHLKSDLTWKKNETPFKTRLKYFSVYKREQRLKRLTKNYIIIQGDLCLEKPFELAAKTNFRQKQLFVYKNLFTLLGHMTNFVYQKSWQELYKAIYALKRLTRRFFSKSLKTIQQFLNP